MFLQAFLYCYLTFGKQILQDKFDQIPDWVDIIYAYCVICYIVMSLI